MEEGGGIRSKQDAESMQGEERRADCGPNCVMAKDVIAVTHWFRVKNRLVYDEEGFGFPRCYAF